MKMMRTGKRRDRKPVKIKRPPSPVSKHGYTERNRNLLALGFRSYSEYLHSEMWKLIRKLAFDANGKRCLSCGAIATQIHHSSYDMKTLVGSDLTHLHPACESCHESAEVVDGQKTHHKEANDALGVKGKLTNEDYVSLFRKRRMNRHS